MFPVILISIAFKSSGVNKVISGESTLTINFNGNHHLLQRFRTKSSGAVKLIHV